MKTSDDNPCLLSHDRCLIYRLVFVPSECYLSLDEKKPSTNGTKTTWAMGLHLFLETIP